MASMLKLWLTQAWQQVRIFYTLSQVTNMSYIMINGIDNPRELIFNGTQPKCLVYNGEIVWVAELISPEQENMTEANRGEGV